MYLRSTLKDTVPVMVSYIGPSSNCQSFFHHEISTRKTLNLEACSDITFTIILFLESFKSFMLVVHPHQIYGSLRRCTSICLERMS